ncbi:MAG TPA: hypothetical protein VI968_01485 [archaeon]|nr:hypothetical protein [archaeon]
MVLDVISSFFLGLGEAGILLLLIIFLVVVLSLNKIFRTAKGIVPTIMHFLKMLLAVSVASALFPVFAGRLLGLPVAVSADSMLFFVTVGITLYFFYLFAVGVYRFLGTFEKHMPSLPKRSRKSKDKFDFEKQLKEGKKKLQKEERKAISSDGDTSKFVKPKKSNVIPLKEISFEEKDD